MQGYPGVVGGREDRVFSDIEGGISHRFLIFSPLQQKYRVDYHDHRPGIIFLYLFRYGYTIFRKQIFISPKKFFLFAAACIPRLVSSSAGNLISDSLIHRKRLTGHNRLVDRGLSGLDASVHRYRFTREDPDTSSFFIRRAAGMEKG